MATKAKQLKEKIKARKSTTKDPASDAGFIDAKEELKDKSVDITPSKHEPLELAPEPEPEPFNEIEDAYLLSQLKEYEKLKNAGTRFKAIEKDLKNNFGGQRVKVVDIKSGRPYYLYFETKVSRKVIVSSEAPPNEVIDDTDPDVEHEAGAGMENDELG